MTEDKQQGQPLVTVVIPTYNRADYIAETIESVLSQSYPNIEVIVIDDGSTDDTAKVVARFVPQVSYVQQENAERGASRNHGLRLARGDYVAFLDSDDLWLSTKVADDVSYLEANPDVGLIHTDAIIIDAVGRELRVLRSRAPSGRVTGALLERNFVTMATHLARASVVREIGGFREERELSGSEDWEMWVRLSLRTNIAYLPRVSAKLRTHPGNTMTNASAMRRSMTAGAKLVHESEQLGQSYGRNLRRMDANMALVNAINSCSEGDRKASSAHLREAFLKEPRVVLDPRFGYTAFRLLKAFVR